MMTKKLLQYLKEILLLGILVLLLDAILMRYWVSTIKPDLFMSIGVNPYRFQIFAVNILIGTIVFFIKKRFSIVFFINTLVCYWLFLFFWNAWIEDHPYSQTVYNFTIDHRKIQMQISKNPDTFGIYELNPTDSLKIIEMGMHEQKGDSILLTGWENGKTYTMYVYDNKLMGLPESPKEIDLIEN